MKFALAMLAFVSATSAFAASGLIGNYTQKTEMTSAGMSEDECTEAGGRYEDGECTMIVTNSIELKASNLVGVLNVSVSTKSTRGNLCELEFQVRSRGRYLIPTQRLEYSEADYNLGLLVTAKGLRVVETGGTGSSPGCGSGARISGSGEEYLKVQDEE